MPEDPSTDGAERVDLLIARGAVLTLDREENVYDPGFVAIRGSQIVAVGPGGDAPGDAAETLDASGCLVFPGLINGHTHAPMTLFRGLADDLALSTWLNEHIFPAERSLTADLVFRGAMLAIAEMLASGVTTFADGYFFEHSVARAVEKTGIRAIVGQGVVDFPAPGVPDPEKNIAHARELMEHWDGRSRLIAPAVFCHSPYTCSEKTLTKAKELAREYRAPFQIHLSETAWEVDTVMEKTGKRPGVFLNEIGLLDEATQLVHCVYLDEGEMDLVAGKGCGVIHCPESNMKLASGIAPMKRMLEMGAKVALGTDGAASNNDLDILSEMRTAMALGDVTPKEGVLSVTRAAAGALGLGDRLGSLAPGHEADVVVAKLKHPRVAVIRDPMLALACAIRRGDVRDVVVAGRFLLREKRHTTLDLRKVMDEAIEIRNKISLKQ